MQSNYALKRIPVAACCKAWVCGRCVAGIVGSKPVRGMDVSRFRVLCVVRYSSLRWADHSPGGVLPTVLCLNVIVKLR